MPHAHTCLSVELTRKERRIARSTFSGQLKGLETGRKLRIAFLAPGLGSRKPAAL